MKHGTNAGSAALLVLSFSFVLGQASAEDEIQKATVIQSLPTKADPAQTYALYLPSGYTAAAKWPVLICLDPSARGHLPVECFRDAAEKYGYILVGSNNSRNGPMAGSQTAAQAILYDLVERLSIDEKRLYMAGFSGGARVACWLAERLNGRVAGVIGCGAGFSEELDPSAATPFAFCGTVGFEDYNFSEMKITDRKLARLGIPHHLLYFEGAHSWPPPLVAVEAIEWLETQAMKTGRRPLDGELAKTLAQKMVDRAAIQGAEGSIPEAVRTCQHLVDALTGLIDTSAAQRKAASLIELKEYRRQVKQERELEEQELNKMGQIRALIAGLADLEQRFDLFQNLHELMTSLEKRAKDPRNSEIARQARRLLNYVGITAFYAAEPLIGGKQCSLAALYCQIQADVNPESASIQIRLATALGHARDKKKTLAALKKAAEKGFSNVARLEDPAFDFLRPEPEFRQLVREVETNQQKKH